LIDTHTNNDHIALPVPLELTPSVIARGKIEVARNYLRITEGEIHRHGSFWRIPFCLATNLEIARYAVIDTGAMPTICKADALRQLDPDFESKLITIPLKSPSGLQGRAEIMGVYVTSLLLPHAEHPLLLERVEFLVAKHYAIQYDFILGQDTGEYYRFQLLRPNRNNAHLKVGSHRQLFYLSGQADLDVSKLITWKKERVSRYKADLVEEKRKSPIVLPWKDTNVSAISMDDLPTRAVADKFPSNNPDISFDDFMHSLTGPFPDCSPYFREALNKAHIWEGMTDSQREMLKRVIAANENSFALKGVIYERSQLGEKLHIQAKIPNPIPKNLKRSFYPLSHKGKEDMKKHLDEMLEEGIIQPSTAPFSAPGFVVYKSDPNNPGQSKTIAR
jgi:hypothetical protein